MQKQNASVRKKKNVISSWIEEELAGMDLADRRLVRRAKTVMSQFAQQPSASIPQACQEWDAIKGAYRFLSNDRVQPGQLLEPHVRATVKRMQSHPVVLAVQDTTTLNYSAHPDTEGLGPVGGNRQTIGFFLHTTLVVTPDGCPLGALRADCYSRSAKTFGRGRKSKNRNTKAVKEKESQRWVDSVIACQQMSATCPNTTIINVADREGDIYELFAQALQKAESPAVHLLVRVQHNRKLDGESKRLWSHLESQPEAATIQVKVPRQGGQGARVATLSVRFCQATISAPCLKENQPALSLWAVEARELHPPKGVTALMWRLLTTLPVSNAQQAIERIGWYAQRWQIEIWHKVLKSGCQIERRQLETALRLQRALMLDLIVAWRVMYLGQVLRQDPEQPADLHLSTAEWKVLWRRFNHTSDLPSGPPSIRQAVRWIAKLGGFIGRNSDGEPGPIVLWRGLHRLNDLVDAWLFLNCG